jgi:hypothetical protein
MISDATGSIAPDVARSRAASLLSLAAAPTFAIMALLTAAGGGAMPDVLCSAAGSMLTGMLPMYLLMSVFHLAPWLRLFSGTHRLSPSSA